MYNYNNNYSSNVHSRVLWARFYTIKININFLFIIFWASIEPIRAYLIPPKFESLTIKLELAILSFSFMLDSNVWLLLSMLITLFLTINDINVIRSAS